MLPNWFLVDLMIIMVYGIQHTLLTTKVFVKAYNKILPKYSWNIVYSLISVATLVSGFFFWQSSGEIIYHLVPGSFGYHFITILLALSLFLFFYCFKYTTSFWQWLGVKQIISRIKGKKDPEYYRVRRQGVKKYIRFPHHTCLIFFFWLHPVMTLDTLLLSIGATLYLYLGTYHQDLRGLSAIGKEWSQYRENTCLLIPGPNLLGKMWRDIFGSEQSNAQIELIDNASAK